MDEPLEEIGYLTGDGLLFCSQTCAGRHGRHRGFEIDRAAFDALLEGEIVGPGSLCPGCGGEFDVEWPESAPN